MRHIEVKHLSGKIDRTNGHANDCSAFSLRHVILAFTVTRDYVIHPFRQNIPFALFLHLPAQRRKTTKQPQPW